MVVPLREDKCSQAHEPPSCANGQQSRRHETLWKSPITSSTVPPRQVDSSPGASVDEQHINWSRSQKQRCHCVGELQCRWSIRVNCLVCRRCSGQVLQYPLIVSGTDLNKLVHLTGGGLAGRRNRMWTRELEMKGRSVMLMTNT